MEISQILGWIATILFSIMLLPQIIKTIKSKDTKGVSLALYIIYLIGNVIAIIYTIMINQFPLIFKYAVAIIITMFYIAIYALYYTRYKK